VSSSASRTVNAFARVVVDRWPVVELLREQVQQERTKSRLPSRGLRVALFTNSVEMGGVEEHVRQVGVGLRERGVSVTAIVPEESAIDPLAFAFIAVGLVVTRLTVAWGSHGWGCVTRFFRLVVLLRARQIDVMHVHLTGYTGGRWALLAARLAGVPGVVCTSHIAPRTSQGWRIRLDRAILSRLVDRYVAVSQASSRRFVTLLGLPSSKLVVIPNAVNLEQFAGAVEPARTAIRREHGIPDGAPVIGVLARLNEQKGLAYLIQAMPAILAAHPNVHLLLVGEGPLREALETQARELGVAEQIRFVGYRSNTVEYLRAMDLFVLPSLYEGLPLSVLEAMGAGLPVVATRVDGTPEAVVDGETGLLVPPADPKALARAVVAVLSDRERAARMAVCGRMRAEELSDGALLDRLESVYRSVLGSRQPVGA
jgi:glycosyltransferase involved in cell wall biosynthesis